MSGQLWPKGQFQIYHRASAEAITYWHITYKLNHSQRRYALFREETIAHDVIWTLECTQEEEISITNSSYGHELFPNLAAAIFCVRKRRTKSEVNSGCEGAKRDTSG